MPRSFMLRRAAAAERNVCGMARKLVLKTEKLAESCIYSSSSNCCAKRFCTQQTFRVAVPFFFYIANPFMVQLVT